MKKVFVHFSENLFHFKEKVLKMFKIPGNCHIKTCRPPKERAI